MKFSFYILLLVYFINVSCISSKELVGLWQIDKVNVGNEEMTPVARWTKLHPDHTQVSGNGWLQHSVGTWDYNTDQNTLQIVNINGFKDEFGPFKIQIGNKNMIWTRTEEGQEVTVYLKRIEQIPTAPANQLFGVWGLSEQDTTSASEKKQAYLFFRWDQIFRQGDTDGHFQLGVYKTNGHRNEVELFYYGDPVKLERWNFELIDYSTLRLTQESTDSTIVNDYQRLDFLPN